MTSLQSILENVDTPELLCKCVKCILLVARCYPHIFSTNFRVSFPTLSFQMIGWGVGWHVWGPGDSENKAAAPLRIINDIWGFRFERRSNITKKKKNNYLCFLTLMPWDILKSVYHFISVNKWSSIILLPCPSLF